MTLLFTSMASLSDFIVINHRYIQNGDANMGKVKCYCPASKTSATSSNAQVNTKHFKSLVFH